MAQAGHLALDAAVAPCLLDDHSRLALGCDARTVFKAADVVTSFRKAAAGYGVPASLLSDNAAIFTGSYRGGGQGAPARSRRRLTLPLTRHWSHPHESRSLTTLAEPAQRPPRAYNLRSHTLGRRPTPPALCSLDLWWEYATADHELDRAFLTAELPLVEDRRLGSTGEHAWSVSTERNQKLRLVVPIRHVPRHLKPRVVAGLLDVRPTPLGKPLGFTASMTSGLLARSVFKQVWKREDKAPKATDRSHGWGQVILAAALQGAIFGAIKAIIDRGGAYGFRRLTGSWPGRT